MPEKSGADRTRFGGLRIGIQSFTFREFSLADAIAAVAELGLREIELCGRHLRHEAEEDQHDQARELLEKSGIRMRAYGVVTLKSNGHSNRDIFEFARRWNLETLTANPDWESLDEVSELAEEFGLNIAIHNHGPKSQYPDAATLRAALKGRSKRLGLCLDTGHLLRVPGENPVAVISEFSDRLHAVHLKDMDENHREYVVGKGKLDLAAVLSALKSVEFTGPISIEYEDHPQDPRPALQEALKRIEEAVG